MNEELDKSQEVVYTDTTDHMESMEGHTTAQVDSTETASTSASDVEKQAKEKGWSPEKGELSAKEYLARESFFKKINSQNKKITKLESTIENLTKLYYTKHKGEIDANLEHLDRVIRDSDDAGEIRKAYEVRAKFNEKAQSLEGLKPAETQSANGVAPEALEFVKAHKAWFDKTTPKGKVITEFALKRSDELIDEHGMEDLSTVFDLLEEEIRTKYERPTKKIRAPEAEGVGSSSSGGGEYASLSPFDKVMYDKLVKEKGVPKDIFFKNLKAYR